jgi:hypothetical protein
MHNGGALAIGILVFCGVVALVVRSFTGSPEPVPPPTGHWKTVWEPDPINPTGPWVPRDVWVPDPPK